MLTTNNRTLRASNDTASLGPFLPGTFPPRPPFRKVLRCTAFLFIESSLWAIPSFRIPDYTDLKGGLLLKPRFAISEQPGLHNHFFRASRQRGESQLLLIVIDFSWEKKHLNSISAE